MVAIFPGHVGKDPGAIDKVHTSDTLFTIEAVINGMIAVQVRDILSVCGIESALYGGSLELRVAEANGDQCALGIAIHCDSFEDVSIRGMHTIIYPKSVWGNDFALRLVSNWNKINTHIPILRDYPKTDNSLYVLKNTSFPVVLVELGFLTNPQDEVSFYIDKCRDEIASILSMSIIGTLSKMRGG